MTDIIERPVLTMPEAEADWLRSAYAEANVILEYGSGGSTVMGAEMGEKTIFSVESDRKWAGMMQDWFDANETKSDVHIQPVWVGPTGKWGTPTKNETHGKWPKYPLKIWDLESFQHPDVVLVDGRFRTACFLATLFRITKPVTLYFDDYIDREHYHMVEDFVPRTETRGRMARFDLTPQVIKPENLLKIITEFAKKR